ncbi:hypothetical protein [Sinosporangium siamense]|uniref:Uncharacterized protein n=1 Tax=Sinosporangium siamense TaxID=1367973 RepID=A0A919RPD6_9ACTN|nr:hypothetical protein [Sinosporangium siamense]GII97480.1 hypothetical protein Ssi02_77110 [Sinosporangium siamense]
MTPLPLRRAAGVAGRVEFVATVAGEGAAPAAMPESARMPPEALETMGRIQGNLDYFSHVLLPVLRFEPDVAALRTVRRSRRLPNSSYGCGRPAPRPRRMTGLRPSHLGA